MQCQWKGAESSAVTRQQTLVLRLWVLITDIEPRHAPIESEMLAVVFTFHKFHQYMYIYGRSVMIETDRKPLQAISTKPLSQVPLRL